MSLNENTVETYEADIRANETLLRSLMGSEDWHWFRYPFLWEGDTLEKRHAIRAYLKGKGYRVAQVTMDFDDYAWNPLYARCVAKKDQRSIEALKRSYLDTASERIAQAQEMARAVYGRDISHVLLLHVGAFDAVMLPSLLDLLKDRRFEFISLQEAESDTAYESDPDLPLKWGGTLLEQMVQAKLSRELPNKEALFKKLDSTCQ